MQDADLDAFFAAHVIDRRLGRLDHAADADNCIFGIFHAVAVQHLITTAGQLVELIHRILHHVRNLGIVFPLRDLALHVAVLVLNNTRS